MGVESKTGVESEAGGQPGPSTAIPRDRFRLATPFEAPREAAELRLVRLWEEILGIRGLGVLDDFFDLGGDSISATALMAEIDRVYGRAMLPSALIKHPTVRSLAALLAEAGTPADGHPLLPIRATGNRPPLFMVHAAWGTVLFARRMLPHLDPGQPLFALQGRGLVEGEEPHTRFEAMAADYAQAIRAVRPQGPYLLAGLCVGGLIALEIARILKAAGEEIRFLGMIDPALHPSVVPWLRWDKPDGVSARLQRTASRLAWHVKRRRLDVARRALDGQVRTPAGYVPPDLGRQAAVHAGAKAALKAYRPLPYDGPVTIFFSKEHRADFEANAGRTQALAPRIDIVELGVLHEHLFAAELNALGRALQRRLDLAAEGEPGAKAR